MGSGGRGRRGDVSGPASWGSGDDGSAPIWGNETSGVAVAGTDSMYVTAVFFSSAAASSFATASVTSLKLKLSATRGQDGSAPFFAAGQPQNAGTTAALAALPSPPRSTRSPRDSLQRCDLRVVPRRRRNLIAPAHRFQVEPNSSQVLPSVFCLFGVLCRPDSNLNIKRAGLVFF